MPQYFFLDRTMIPKNKDKKERVDWRGEEEEGSPKDWNNFYERSSYSVDYGNYTRISPVKVTLPQKICLIISDSTSLSIKS